MSIYLICLLILLLTVLIFIIEKNKWKALKINGLISIISSILLIGVTFIIRSLISISVDFINLTSLVDYIFYKFLIISIILFVIGLIEILVSKYFINRKIKS